MRPASIRLRLSLWYFAIFAVTFGMSGIGLLAAMRWSVKGAFDEELRIRLAGVQRFLERHDPAESFQEMQAEFREHSGLRPGGDLLQVSDSEGTWLFRSASMRRYDLGLSRADLRAPLYDTLDANGQRLRVLAARITVAGRNYTAQLGAPVADAYELLDRFQWLFVLSIPLVLVLASAGGYWMSRRALAPVDEITRAARAVSEHNLSNRLVIPGAADELQRLTQTFNEMLERLDAAFKRITQFTANASHELRTPVALVRTTAEVALRRPRHDQEYREALGQILGEAERMTPLIDSLMTLARVDSGTEVLSFSAVDIASLVREACARSEPLAGSKQIHVEREIPDDPVTVNADAHALERLFLILIDNAIRYTPGGGRIRVGLKQAADHVDVSVEDTGIGIPPDAVPFIFERFYRVDTVRSREAGGAGLGLSIARWIAEAHRASIRVDSTPGHGSTFEVRLNRTTATVV